MCDCGKCRCDPGFSGALCDTCLVNLPELIQINTYHAVFSLLLLKNEKKISKLSTTGRRTCN